MFRKLEGVEARFEDLNLKLQDPQIISQQSRYRELMKELSQLRPIVEAYRRYRAVKDSLRTSFEILQTETDEEMKALAKEDMTGLEMEQNRLEIELKGLLLPHDPTDEKNIIMEIRAGAGGDEASLFAEQIFRAYTHYASNQGWKTEILSTSTGNVGGYKEVICMITGERVFSRLKYESGVHRVQRVPKTENQGRIHTSTITVAVLPEANEVDVQINPLDLRIDVFRAGGHGGQSVNTTDSAVRIIHVPSGLVVSCQDEKSQLKNKSKAMKVLYARLLALEKEKAQKQASEARLSQIGTGDRSERIRTYNFPQSRVTDHRIGLTVHQLGQVMEGAFEQLIDPLTTHYQAEALKSQAETAPLE